MTAQTIGQRIREVQKQVAYIRKEKKVETYMAVTHDQVTAEIREWIVAHGILINPRLVEGATVATGKSTAKGNPIVRYDGVFDVEYINADDINDKFVSRVPASAEDHGDKAPGKALSYAVKASELKVFLIETGENEESRFDHEGLSADRIVAMDKSIDEANNLVFLRDLLKGYLAEAHAAGDSYAHKRMKERAEKRAKELDGELRQRPAEKAAETAQAATDREPGQDETEPAIQPPAPAKAEEPKKAPVKSAAKGVPAGQPPSAGYLKHTKKAIETAGETEADALVAAGVADLSTIENCNAVLAALKAAA